MECDVECDVECDMPYLLRGLLDGPYHELLEASGRKVPQGSVLRVNHPLLNPHQTQLHQDSLQSGVVSIEGEEGGSGLIIQGPFEETGGYQNSKF